MTSWPAPSLRHLSRLTDAVGVVEHATRATPRTELGYCTDDAGRALAVASRLAGDPYAERIATVAIGFLEAAHLGGGVFRLRREPHGWTGDRPSDDGNGRALLGLGAATTAPWRPIRERAAQLLGDAASFRSEHPRASAYAALAAVEWLRGRPDNAVGLRLVGDAADVLGALRPDAAAGWCWPAPRLTCANALLPHAMAAAADALDRPRDRDDALGLLAWLVDEETRGDRLSPTPVGGRGPDDRRPGFDQQPIEAWAIAEGCVTAHRLVPDRIWIEAVHRAGRWFLGGNDAGVPMFDPVTGGGFDGLARDGVNANQGAESSLAFVATMRAVRSIDASWLTPGAALRLEECDRVG